MLPRLTIGCSDTNKKTNCTPSLAHLFTVAISANHGLIMLKKLSRKLVSLYIFSFVNSLYSVHHAYVQTFGVIETKF
jgi:hypothetical protein